jgi:hypothetical protein
VEGSTHGLLYYVLTFCLEENSVKLPGLLDEIQSRGIQNMKEEG